MALKVDKRGFHPSFMFGDIEYYIRNNNYGFGYEIMKAIPMAGQDRKFYERYFRANDKEVVKKIFFEIVETESLPDELPDTSQETTPMVLKLRTKHHDYHYKVDTVEELEKVARHILKWRNEEHWYINPYNEKPSKENIGFDSKEEIENLKAGNVKYYALQAWDAYEYNLKEQSRRERDWDNFQHVMEGKGGIGNVMRALESYEHENYDLITLDLIE